MKLLALILCSVLPAKAFAHYVCSELEQDSRVESTHPNHFRVYLPATGRVSVSGTQNSEPFLSLVGEWEEENEGRLAMTLRDANDIVWSASGTRYEFTISPRFHHLNLSFNSELGQSFALKCMQTELY